ncbi:MAG: TrbC/VirB2 family protein [Lactobacillus sp.]|nr:TrbC/VirB2 family protein [Lactobacillus sp.]
MQFLKRNILTLSCLAFICLLAFTGDASAQANTLMGLAKEKTRNVFENVKTIIFIVGGFGLVGLAFAAIFGKVKWNWFAALAVGLAILAAAGSIVEYATGSKVDFTDTFGSSAPN